MVTPVFFCSNSKCRFILQGLNSNTPTAAYFVRNMTEKQAGMC